MKTVAKQPRSKQPRCPPPYFNGEHRALAMPILIAEKKIKSAKPNDPATHESLIDFFKRQPVFIPEHILELAREDVKLHGLSDGSVKEEDKHPDVRKFLLDAWQEIGSLKMSVKEKRAGHASVLKLIYPNEHDDAPPLLKQNSALYQLFKEHG